jgi:hypothetical protein
VVEVDRLVVRGHPEVVDADLADYVTPVRLISKTPGQLGP